MAGSIEARVAGIIATTGRIDPGLLTGDVELAGLGLDSIVMVEAIFAIEEAFDIVLPFDMGAGTLTLGHLCELVAGCIQARP